MKSNPLLVGRLNTVIPAGIRNESMGCSRNVDGAQRKPGAVALVQKQISDCGEAGVWIDRCLP